MNVAESFRIAVHGLLANKLRSALTMLGILIGVGAVILLVAVGTGSSTAVQQRIENLGTNTLVIFRQGGFGARGARTGTNSRRTQLTPADVKALQDKQTNPDVKEVAPSVNAQVTASYQGSTYSPGQFVGTTPNYAGIRKYDVAEGAFFTNDDETGHQRVAVLGQTVVTNLFGPTADPLGATVQFNSASFRVVGIFKAKGSNGVQDQDDIVMAPLTAVEDTLTGVPDSYGQITVEAASRQQQSAAADEVTSTLLSTHSITNGTPDFNVLNQAALLQTSSDTNRVFTVLLGAVAAISLLVGGIGVMNIMLVTVTERTREIGIRKAVGARRVDILGQFLVEAVLLSVVGGIVGVVAGVGGSHFKIVGVTPVVQTYSVILAFAVALLVGLFFGLYPANRAASLRPIEALRYE
jgi:putative ABC transport system permease protein